MFFVKYSYKLVTNINRINLYNLNNIDRINLNKFDSVGGIRFGDKRYFMNSLFKNEKNYEKRDLNYVKNNIFKYYTKKEVITLFLQPLVVIIIYILSLWHLFKYTCNIKDINDFVKKIKWIKE